MNYKKIDNVIRLCYIEIYKNSIPYADFEELLENAPLDNNGKKIINFNDYEIKNKTFYEIMNKICKDNKVTKKEKESISIHLHLGATPRFVDKTIYERRIEVLNKIKNKIKNN